MHWKWIVLIVVVLGILALFFWMRRYPLINDISTDLADPPAFEAVREGASPPGAHPGAAVAAMQREAYPDIAPLVMDAPPHQVFPAARAAAEFMGWRIDSADAERGRLQAVAVTRLLRFKDDVVVRLRAEGGGTRIDVRSKSRLGRGDFGANARRIRAYFDQVRAVWSRGW